MTRRRISRIAITLLTAMACVIGLAAPAVADDLITIEGTAVLRGSPGQVAVLTQSWTSEAGWTDEVEATTTDASGAYSLTLDKGYYRIRFVSLVEGYHDEYYNNNYSAPTATLFLYSRALDPVVLEQTFSAHGSVQLESVGPAAAGVVSVALAPVGAVGPTTTAATDAAGNWQVDGLPAIDYTATFQLVDGSTHAPLVRQLSAQALAQGAVVTLPRINTVSGDVVLGSPGRPAAAGEVTVILRRSIQNGMFLEIARDETDAAGRYEFGGLVSDPTTRYTVCSEGAGLFLGDCALAPRIFTLQGADEVENLRLARAGSISGVVTTISGAPLSDIEVVSDYYQQDSYTSFLGSSSSTSGAGGAWSLDPAHEGFHDVYLLDEEGVYAPVNLDGTSYYLNPRLLSMGRSQVRSGYVVRMPLAGAIHGRIGGLTAQELLDGTTEIELIARPASTWVHTGYTWQADPDGSFVVGGLTPGTYRLEFTYHGPAGTSIVTSPDLTLAEGAERDYSPVLGERTFADETTAFVRALYDDFLGRAPSTNDMRFWAAAIEGGVPRSSIVQGFATSDEYRLIRIDAAYQGILGRAAESSGRQWWLAQMKAGNLSTDDIERQFYGSKEYATGADAVCARVGDPTAWGRVVVGPGGVPAFVQPDFDPAAFVRCLYYDLMGREPDAAGLSYWAGLAATNGRQYVVDELWRAPEVARSRVAGMYALYLGRTPDANGLTFWTAFIVAHGDTTTRASITESGEYFRLSSQRYPNG